jgi:hypothetical protein
MTTEDFIEMLGANGSLIDVKSILDPEVAQKSGVSFWRL